MKYYLFNPEHDMALASYSPYYKAPAEIIRMKEDLSVLPVWYAERGSGIQIGASKVAEAFSEQCHSEILKPWGALTILGDADDLVPWGWDPALVHWVQSGLNGCVDCPDSEGLERIKHLSGRQRCAEILSDFNDWPAVCGESVVCGSLEEVELFLKSHSDVILKAPWSGSGRGLARTSLSTFTDNLKGWVSRIIRTQAAIMAEPLYNKVVDFAMEFKMADELSFVGFSLFETDSHGNYKQNVLISDKAIVRHLTAYVPYELIMQVRDQLLQSLSKMIGNGYHGYLGVDMMICESEGKYFVHPCVEINLRMNMGVVARLLFDRYVHPASKGTYVVAHFNSDGEALLQHHDFCTHYTACMKEGRMESGYFPLTPVFNHTRYQCYVILE